MFLKEALGTVVMGVAIGLPAAWASTRYVSHLLVGVEGHHVPVLFGVSLVLGGVALAGSFFPSRRATRLDPIVTLRHE